MPAPQRLATGDLARWPASAVLLTLGTFSLGWLLAAVLALWVFFTSTEPSGPLLVPAALVLTACALSQARLVWFQWRSGQWSTTGGRDWSFWRRLALGAALAYLVALIIGPVRSIGWAWLATVAVVQTLLVLPLATSPLVAEHWRRWTQGRAPRRLTWLVYAATLLPFVCEVGLRAYRFTTEASLVSRAVASETGARNDNLQHVALPLDRIKAGRFRVALLSDPQSPAIDNLSDRVEYALPGAEMLPLPIALGDADLGASDVMEAVQQVRADLVLLVLPVCEDLSRETIEPSVFDWRQLEVAALMSDEPAAKKSAGRPQVTTFESYLSEVSTHLVACRTPMGDVIRARWERTFDTLDRTIAGCREADVPLALVVVPGEFQLNPGLRDTLLRRAGLSAEQYDGELPQRRLAGFAQQRGLPLVDLLPHLRLCREAVYERHATTLNEQGNQAAASAIGGWVAGRYGDQLASQLSKAP